MPNHFHLALWPLGDGDLGRWMHGLLTAHVRRYHCHDHSTGHVWQGRFKAFPIQEDDHLRVVLRIESLPLYPESRACRRPTARKVIDFYEDVQRHSLRSGKRPPEVFSTELTRLQRRILRLLGMPRAYET